MSKVIDLTGQRFGRLTVIEGKGLDKHRKAIWLCRCDCGKSTVVISNNLRQGRIISCGCVRREQITQRSLIHGKHHTRLYGVWKGMKERCYDPKDQCYARYGGRGITVCDEWLHNFQAFYEWAMANGYDENAPYGQCTIDRIDNDKGYSPENCQWVDMKVQRNNRSDSKK